MIELQNFLNAPRTVAIVLTQFCYLIAYLLLQVSALRYVPEHVGWQTVGVVLGVTAVFVAAAVFISRQ